MGSVHNMSVGSGLARPKPESRPVAIPRCEISANTVHSILVNTNWVTDTIMSMPRYWFVLCIIPNTTDTANMTCTGYYCYMLFLKKEGLFVLVFFKEKKLGLGI